MEACDCVSDAVYSILRPRMPPAALISLTASLTPSLKLVPDTAPVPDSSIRPAIFTVDCAATSDDAANAHASASPLMIPFMCPP